jgi:hypothetical protein
LAESRYRALTRRSGENYLDDPGDAVDVAALSALDVDRGLAGLAPVFLIASVLERFLRIVHGDKDTR